MKLLLIEIYLTKIIIMGAICQFREFNLCNNNMYYLITYYTT